MRPLFERPHVPIGETGIDTYTDSMYRGTLLIRRRLPVEPYSVPEPRALWWSSGGGGQLLMGEVPLYMKVAMLGSTVSTNASPNLERATTSDQSMRARGFSQIDLMCA